MGGLFGSNRLGSTSLTEVAVFGYRAGKDAAEYVKKNKNKIDIIVLNYQNSFFNCLIIMVNSKHIT